jgi:stage II sporulation protein AA (anti-sigma F factor antagonist)
MATTDAVANPEPSGRAEHVVRVVGELDVSNVDRLRALLDTIEEPCAAIVVDLGELTFMDSSGIGVLLERHRRGATVTLRNPSPIVRRLVTATGLDDVLRFET